MYGQQTIDWSILSDVSFETKYDSDMGISFDEAQFGPGVVPLDGTEIAIRGYMIPLDAFGVAYAISRNPNASCFFCGGAGPETVIELKLLPKAMRQYHTDENLIFKGRLELNKSNMNNFTYVLHDAEPLN